MSVDFKDILDANPLIGAEEYLAVRVLRAFNMGGGKRVTAAKELLSTSGYMPGPGQWGLATVLVKEALCREPYGLHKPELLAAYDKKVDTVPKLVEMVRNHPFMVPLPDVGGSQITMHPTALFIRVGGPSDENFVAMTLHKNTDSICVDGLTPVMIDRFYPKKKEKLILLWRLNDFMKTLRVDDVIATLFAQ